MKRFLLFSCITLLSASSVAQIVPMTNDECTTPIALADGVNPSPPLGVSGNVFTNVGSLAALSAGSPAMCSGATGGANNDVWFSYTPGVSGAYTFASCTPTGLAAGSHGDTVLQVLDGSVCPAVTILGCDDDACVSPGLASSITVPLTAGLPYYVRVASWSPTTTDGTFYVTVTLAPPAPANDECTGAITVFDGINPTPPAGASGSTYNNSSALTSTGPAWCGSFSKDVWFAYTATSTGILTADTCTPVGFTAGTLVDTILQITSSTANACPAAAQLGCNDQFCGGRSSATASVTAGTVYFIRVASWSTSAAGTFYLTVGVSPPPPNDDCVGAIPLATGPNGPFTNVAAGDSGVISSCGTGGPATHPGSKDIWFSYTTGPCPSFTVDTGCNGFDTMLGIYDFCGGTELACNDDTPGCGLSSTASVTGTPFTTYFIKASSWAVGVGGSFSVNVTVGNPNMTLVFSSPFGPGSVQIDINDGPPLGTYIWLITGFAGAFPNGWLDGLDIPPNELAAEISAGFPFVGPLDVCGNFSTGPIGGVGFLSGIPLYSIAYGIPTGGVVPTQNTPAITYTIP